MYGLDLGPSALDLEEYNAPGAGPDQVLPAGDFCTANPRSTVQLRIPLWGDLETSRPKSIPTLLREVALNHPTFEAMAYRATRSTRTLHLSRSAYNYHWKFITYKEYHRLVRCCAKAFIKLGLEDHSAVCILGYNCPEWFICNLAAIFAGGIAVGLYSASSRTACEYCIKHSRAHIVVVQDSDQLMKVSLYKFKHVKAIVQYKDAPRQQGVLGWEELLELGDQQQDYYLEETLAHMGVNECCAMIYKNNKAKMFSHDNITWTALSCTSRFKTRYGHEKIVSYMPLHKIANQVLDIYFTMMNAGCTYFIPESKSNLDNREEFKTQFLNLLREVKPTKFVGTPQTWDKFCDTIKQICESQKENVRKTLAWARKKAFQHQVAKIGGNFRNSCGYFVASNVVLNKVQIQLGLNRSTLNASIGAPLTTEIEKFFLSMNMPVCNIYGLSEATGFQTACSEEDYAIGTAGMSFPGTKTIISTPDEDEYGEITMYGRNIFMGYMYDLGPTHKAIDESGWLHSQDIGMIDSQGFVYVAETLKEFLITAEGEGIPIAPLEDAIRKQLPQIHYVVLVGERKKYLAVLLTLRTELGENGEPSDKLKPGVQEWMKQLGSEATTLSAVLRAPPKNFIKAVHEALGKVNQKAASKTQHVRKFALLPTDLSTKANELTLTGRVRRAVVLEKYADLINKMYRDK